MHGRSLSAIQRRLDEIRQERDNIDNTVAKGFNLSSEAIAEDNHHSQEVEKLHRATQAQDSVVAWTQDASENHMIASRWTAEILRHRNRMTALESEFKIKTQVNVVLAEALCDEESHLKQEREKIFDAEIARLQQEKMKAKPLALIEEVKPERPLIEVKKLSELLQGYKAHLEKCLPIEDWQNKTLEQLLALQKEREANPNKQFDKYVVVVGLENIIAASEISLSQFDTFVGLFKEEKVRLAAITSLWGWGLFGWSHGADFVSHMEIAIQECSKMPASVLSPAGSM